LHPDSLEGSRKGIREVKSNQGRKGKNSWKRTKPRGAAKDMGESIKEGIDKRIEHGEKGLSRVRVEKTSPLDFFGGKRHC